MMNDDATLVEALRFAAERWPEMFYLSERNGTRFYVLADGDRNTDEAKWKINVEQFTQDDADAILAALPIPCEWWPKPFGHTAWFPVLFVKETGYDIRTTQKATKRECAPEVVAQAIVYNADMNR